MVSIASYQSVLDAFRWNDASSAWVMLGASFLFHTYARYINETQKFDRILAFLFVSIYLLCVSIAISQNDAFLIESPLLPTLFFSVVWFAQFLGTLRRFWIRRCPCCASKMEIVTSVPDSLSAHLVQYTKIITSDLWFCPKCLCARSSVNSGRTCSVCDVGSCVLKSVQILISPTAESFGTVRLTSECDCCNVRYSERSLLSPLTVGSGRHESERRALMQLDKLEIAQESWRSAHR